MTPAFASASHRLERVRELQARIRELQSPTLGDRALPTTEALARILPGGALLQGSTYRLGGSGGNGG